MRFGWIGSLLLFMVCRLECNEAKLWLNHVTAAENYSQNKRFSDAIESYSIAIRVMEQVSEDPLFVYNERGMTYFKNGDFEDAIADFSKVITTYEETPSSSNLAVAVNALWNRLGVYSRMQEFEKASLDFYKITRMDPNFPVVERFGKTLIIKNLHLSGNSEIEETFLSVIQKLGICSKKEDVLFSRAGIVVIKLDDDFYNSIEEDDLDCVGCSGSLHPRFNGTLHKAPRNNPRKLIECQKWCDDIAYSIGLGCAFCPTPMGKAACAAAVYTLKEGCRWCCIDGNFYKKCIAPLKAFNPKDPAWDNDTTADLPDRDLNDKDLIWNDPDLVYEWDDI